MGKYASVKAEVLARRKAEIAELERRHGFSVESEPEDVERSAEVEELARTVWATAVVERYLWGAAPSDELKMLTARLQTIVDTEHQHEFSRWYDFHREVTDVVDRFKFDVFPQALFAVGLDDGKEWLPDPPHVPREDRELPWTGDFVEKLDAESIAGLLIEVEESFGLESEPDGDALMAAMEESDTYSPDTLSWLYDRWVERGRKPPDQPMREPQSVWEVASIVRKEARGRNADRKPTRRHR